MDIPKYFSNVVLSQFKATGIPLKVYVNDQYLIIPDMYEISDPLIGSGMTPAGDMIQFDYREIDHLLVGKNIIDLATYTKAMTGDTPEEDTKKDAKEDEATEESLDLGEITKDVFKARNKALDAEEKALGDKRKALDDEPIEDGVIKEDYDRDMDRKYGRDRDYTNIEVKDMHFQTDADELEKMKLAYGYRLGGMTTREKIADADYELKRFRKKIKYWNGNPRDKEWAVSPFAGPEHYNTVKSTLGAGPHAKARPKVSWNEKKYDQWLEDVASNDGWKNASDMAQNAKNEPGLIDWVKKNNRGEDAMQRIQWDIEAFAESVVNEEVDRPEEKKTAILNAIAKEEKRSEFQNRILNQIKRAIVDGEPLFKLPFKTQADYRKLMKMYKIPFSSKKAEKGNLRAESVIKKGSYVTNKDGLVGRVDNISGDKEIADIRYNDDTEDSLPIKNLKIFEKSMNEAWIGPFVFGNTTKDDELKAMYNGALDGYANWKNGMVHPRADYKKAYQTIEKLLKRRGIQVESIKEDHAPIDSISEPYMFQVGDFIKNTNTSCDHFGSMGIIQKMFKLADKMIVKYRVVNNGDTFKPGDVLSKTSDQLDPIG